MDNNEKDIVIQSGGMWEETEFIVSLNHRCSDYGGGEPCKHCSPYTPIIHTSTDGERTWKEKSWICPVVIISKNEGGYNSTGVCGLCIVEAIRDVNQFKNLLT